jgi:predicted RNA polymerase sigma factor
VPSGQDDSLALLLMCCHPVLPVPSQLALTLRAVGGLTTAEIARGCPPGWVGSLVPVCTGTSA